jgi:hypothetical protein
MLLTHGESAAPRSIVHGGIIASSAGLFGLPSGPQASSRQASAPTPPRPRVRPPSAVSPHRAGPAFDEVRAGWRQALKAIVEDPDSSPEDVERAKRSLADLEEEERPKAASPRPKLATNHINPKKEGSHMNISRKDLELAEAKAELARLRAARGAGVAPNASNLSPEAEYVAKYMGARTSVDEVPVRGVSHVGCRMYFGFMTPGEAAARAAALAKALGEITAFDEAGWRVGGGR